MENISRIIPFEGMLPWNQVSKKNDKDYNRTISHEGVDKLIRQIHNSSGLVVDYSV
ncbi:MAG: hypothetical protein QNK31_05645 [Porticoccus sp.]|nr:hypothetical protein [Porticoccus sp.]